MKKILFGFLVVVIIVAGVQVATLFYAKDKLANQASDLPVATTNKQITSGLFNTKTYEEFDFMNYKFGIESDTKHILGIISTQGKIKAINEPLLSLSKMLFKDEYPINYDKIGNKIKFNIKDAEVTHSGTTFSLIKPIFEITKLDDKNTNFGMSIQKIGASALVGDMSINNISYSTSLQSMQDVKNLDADAILNSDLIANNLFSIDKMTFSIPFLFDLRLDDLKEKDSYKRQNGFIDLDIDLLLKKLKFMNLKFSDLNLNFNLEHIKNFDANALLENPTLEVEDLNFDNIFVKGSKISLNNLGFNTPDAKTGLNFNLVFNKDLKDLTDIVDGIEASGSFFATKPLSQMFGEFGSFIQDIENELLEANILKQEKNGYMFNFKTINKDIIFNDDVSLTQIIKNGVVSMF